MSRILVLFSSVFKRHLLAANTCLSCVIDGLGDYLEQKLEGAEHVDKYRTARFTSLGLVFGPWEFYWYHLLDTWWPGRATKVVIRKVLLDEFLMSPIEYVVFYVGQCANMCTCSLVTIYKQNSNYPLQLLLMQHSRAPQ